LIFIILFLSLFSLHSSRNFRSEHSNAMATLAAAEPENSNEESPPEGSASKSPPNKRPVPVPSPPKTTAAPAAPSKKGLVSNLCSQLSIFFYFF
jgi:hypothetical protein